MNEGIRIRCHIVEDGIKCNKMVSDLRKHHQRKHINLSEDTDKERFNWKRERF